MAAAMHFQRSLNVRPGMRQPDYLAVFIGGFCDVLMGCLSRLEAGFPGFLPGAEHLTAYYHWDGGGWGVFRDRCGRIAEDLAQARRAFPETPMVLIGHSYGGSCTLEVARKLPPLSSPLCLVTLDAVARRQKNLRPESADWWGNSYLSEGGGLMDAVPRIGGRWGHCGGADVNLSFSGFRTDRTGCLYSHRRPAPLLYESPEEGGASLYEEAACWLKGTLGR